MSPQYGELRPTSDWYRLTSLGYPCKFQLVLCLGSVTARHLVVGVSQTLRRWTEGATYIRQGDHHVGHWTTFLVSIEVAKADWQIGATWRIRLNPRSAAAMRPYVKLLWPPVHIVFVYQPQCSRGLYTAVSVICIIACVYVYNVLQNSVLTGYVFRCSAVQCHVACCIVFATASQMRHRPS